MKCPNCGESFDKDIIICPICNTPLSNADYIPVEKKKRKFLIPVIVFVILALLGAGGYFLYQYYLGRVETECIKATKQIFTYVEEMDFSEVDSAYLPDILKENPNIRDLISDYADEYLENSSIGSILKKANYSFDTDALCDDILSTASYKITDVNTTYNSCEVTVVTSNKSYPDILDALITKVTSELAKDQSFWSSITHSISGFLFGNDEEETSIADTIQNTLTEYYEECKEEAENRTYTGTITYAIVDGEWTLKDFDKNLIYNYYGIDEEIISSITEEN